MFVDARTDCNKLTFHLGNYAVGLAKVDTRSWSLKVKVGLDLAKEMGQVVA